MKRKFLDIIRQIWKLPYMERLVLQLTMGQEFGSLLSRLPPNFYQYPPKTYRQATRGGINYMLDLSDYVDWFIYFGFKESARHKLYALMAPGQTIIDVGANVGDVSLHAAQLVGPRGTVHAFEPDPNNALRFAANIARNSFTNIRNNSLGLGDAAGSYQIASVKAGNQGMNRIVTAKCPTHESRQIEVITLDAYSQTAELSQVDLIKIDVEGFEFNVLRGGETLIKRFHPQFFIELDDQNLREQGSSAAELVGLLEAHGYEVEHAQSSARLTAESDFSACHYDIIATHRA